MANKYIFLPLVILIIYLSGCTKNEQKTDNGNYVTSSRDKSNDSAKGIYGIYRYYWGEKDKFKVWIVDGAEIRRQIFNEFIYGGNSERYPFVPEGEIWIDNSISSEEFETTLAHEINERNLMARYAMTYFDAHDSSLALEVKMRRGYLLQCNEHESKLPNVSPTDFDSTKEIEDIPEMIKLKNIYRIPLGERNGIKLWVVDGYAVRRDIYPDFGFSGNGLAYHFIQPNEIWIDGSVTCEETEYSIAQEMKERELLAKGMSYDSSYTEAVKVSDKMRTDNLKLVTSQPQLKISGPLYRDTGTGKEKNSVK
jgi:hypothetical protein